MINETRWRIVENGAEGDDDLTFTSDESTANVIAGLVADWNDERGLTTDVHAIRDTERED